MNILGLISQLIGIKTLRLTKIKRKTLGTIIMCRTQFLFDSKYMISYILILKIHKRKQY